MICAAQYSVDKQWYRARVLELPGGAQVKVQYVDFGNTEVLHHQSLKKLFDKFFKLNIQAIPCKLAHVTYNQALGWSPEVSFEVIYLHSELMANEMFRYLKPQFLFVIFLISIVFLGLNCMI